MLVCFFKKQVEILLTLDAIEVDMAFKRVQSTELNEIEFATYENGQKKGIINTSSMYLQYVNNIFSAYSLSSAYESTNWTCVRFDVRNRV